MSQNEHYEYLSLAHSLYLVRAHTHIYDAHFLPNTFRSKPLRMTETKLI